MDKSKLLAKRIRTVEVVINDEGDTVTVQSLSREDALKIANKNLPVDELERFVLSRSMVDPELTEDEVAEWQSNSEAGEIQAVFEEVLRLSGLSKDAGKAAYKSSGE